MKTIDDAADASKYDTEHKLKIRRIYERIPSNMENKKKRITVQAIEGKKEVNYLIDDYDSLSVVPLSPFTISCFLAPLRRKPKISSFRLSGGGSSGSGRSRVSWR